MGLQRTSVTPETWLPGDIWKFIDFKRMKSLDLCAIFSEEFIRALGPFGLCVSALSNKRVIATAVSLCWDSKYFTEG